MSPHPRSPTSQGTGAGPRPAPPAPAQRPGPGGAGQGWEGRSGMGAQGRPRPNHSPRARAMGSPGERMLRRGVAAVGEGSLAGLSLTASFSSSWPGLRGCPRSGSYSAPLLQRLNVQPGRAEPQRIGAAEGRVASGAEGVGKMGRLLSPPPRPPQTPQPPAPLSHGSCGPSHHTRLQPSTPLAGEVTAALANQRPCGGRARRATGRARKGAV